MKVRKFLILAATTAIALGCGKPSVPQEAVAKVIQSRVATLDPSPSIRGERLLEPKAVTRFYQARKMKPAWPEGKQEPIVESIRGLARDGLDPSDYHLAAIEKLLEERKKTRTAELEADLDLILSDAIAAAADHVRFGRVRPVALDPRWNVNPREGAPPLEERLATIAGARSVSDAIESERPRHFIYRGLVGALARLRVIETKGGWATVPAGPAIRPGASDSRLPAVRARLAATGELKGGSESGSTTYDADLRKAVELFQARHRLDPNGIIDKDTIEAMNVSTRDRVAQVRVNLERARWVLGGLEDDFLLVNLPAFKAYLIRDGRNVWEARTQVGEEASQTPSFRADMRTIVFNPDWTVPPTILAEEILPAMARGENVLAKQNLQVVDNNGRKVDPGEVDWGSASPGSFSYTLRQPPGTGNALGRVKFLFPNPYSIYLHDTPSKHLFEAERRTFSHGCIRLERPLELAEILLSGQRGWSRNKIEQDLASGETENVALANSVPVLIVYWTVSVGASGEIRYMRDFYGKDPPVLAALNAPPRASS